MKLTVTRAALAFALCLSLPGSQAPAQHAGQHIMLDPSELSLEFGSHSRRRHPVEKCGVDHAPSRGQDRDFEPH